MVVNGSLKKGFAAVDTNQIDSSIGISNVCVCSSQALLTFQVIGSVDEGAAGRESFTYK